MKPPITRLLSAAALASATLVSTPILAQTTMDHGTMKMDNGTAGATATPGMADAEVRKIDQAAGKITLKHGEIKNLNMPPMTMVFGVRDKALLNRVAVGAKVRFTAVMDQGQMVVTDLQPAMN